VIGVRFCILIIKWHLLQLGYALFCGGTDFEVLGKKKLNKAEQEQREPLYPNVRGPSKIKGFEDTKFRLVATVRTYYLPVAMMLI
jgi:hypothetical protein